MSIKEKRQYVLGLDIGGTNIKAVLFNGGKIVADDSLATPKDNLKNFLTMLNALIEPMLEKAKKDKMQIKGIGLGIAGPVDYEKQKIIKAPNIPLLDNIELAEELKRKVDRPIKIDNDANCFLLAEVMLGGAQKYKNIYGITLGTDIGSAWWFNNNIYRGFHGSAGELTHTIIDFNEPISLKDAYQKLTQNNPAQVAEEAYRGDNLAKKTYEEIGKILGISFANIVNLISPEAIIIGGGVIESDDLFMSEIKKNMRLHIISPEAKKIKILKSKLKEKAGAIGAALLFP